MARLATTGCRGCCYTTLPVGRSEARYDESTFIAVYALFSQEQLAEIAGVYEDIAALRCPMRSLMRDSAMTSPTGSPRHPDLMCAQLVDRFAQEEGAIAGMFSVLSDAMQADWRVIRTIGALPKSTVTHWLQNDEMAETSLRARSRSASVAVMHAQWISASPSLQVRPIRQLRRWSIRATKKPNLWLRPTELFLKHDTDGTDSLSYPQVFTLIEDEGFSVPLSLDWFDSMAVGHTDRIRSLVCRTFAPESKTRRQACEGTAGR